MTSDFGDFKQLKIALAESSFQLTTTPHVIGVLLPTISFT